MTAPRRAVRPEMSRDCFGVPVLHLDSLGKGSKIAAGSPNMDLRDKNNDLSGSWAHFDLSAVWTWNAVKHIIVIFSAMLAVAGCAELRPYFAPPADPAPAPAEAKASPPDSKWVPPQPFPGPVKAKKVPLPDEKPKAAVTASAMEAAPATTSTESGESTQKTQIAALLPQDIVGMNQARVASTLGPPFAQSEKPPARIWQYRGVDCILKVRFFLDLNDQSFRALSVDAARTDGEKDAPERCIAQVMAARH